MSRFPRMNRRKGASYNIDALLLFEIRDLLERFEIATKIGPKELTLAREIQELRELAEENSRRIEAWAESQSIDPDELAELLGR